MNIAAAMLIVRLVAEGVGVAVEIADLAKRVENGETVTEDDIKTARREINGAVQEWEDS